MGFECVAFACTCCPCRFMQSSIFVCKDKLIVLLDYSSVVKIIWQIPPLITWFCLTPPISVKIMLRDTKLPPAASLSLPQLSPDRHLYLQPHLYRRNYNNQHLTGLSHAPSWPISWALKPHHHGNIKSESSQNHILTADGHNWGLRVWITWRCLSDPSWHLEGGWLCF